MSKIRLPIYKKSNESTGPYIAPEVFCPICDSAVYAEFVDNGFGPYAVQVSPYHCENCNWIEGGCISDDCDRCICIDTCQGRARK